MVTSLTVTFSRQVDLAAGAVSVTNTLTGQSIPLTINPQAVNGVTVLSIGFTGPGVLGGSVPDGRYTLTILATDVTDAATGGVMSANSTTPFTRLFGDLTGSGTYDPAARWMVQDALGSIIGTSGYIASLDVNSDGVINETDVLAVVRNWGKSLPPASPPVVPPVTPVDPTVTSVVVNDGAVQRSMVTSLTVTFSRAVDLADGAVSVTNTLTGQPILLYLDPARVNGVTVLTITFGGTGVIGGSVPDGRYTLTIQAAKVTDAGTGGAMQSSSTTAFTRLFGDLTGSGTYDPAARWMVQDALGSTIGTSGYIAALDVNSDGVINETDILAVVRNWGKSLPPA
jgi:hypothetical protein